MLREMVGPMRVGWRGTMQADGFVYNTSLDPNGTAFDYWVEGPHYVLTLQEIEMLERAVKTLHEMCIEAGDHMLAHPQIMRRMGIPETAFSVIRRTWDKNPPNVYGRFDLRYAGPGPQAEADPTLLVPKLLEYNADTPTSLFEAAVLQWRWLEFSHSGADQWNSIEERLIRAWVRNIGIHELRTGRCFKRIHFAYTSEEESGEDLMNTAYMADLAFRAASIASQNNPDYEVVVMAIEDVGLHKTGYFYDQEGHRIDLMFKLFPWEWMLRDRFGPAALHNMGLNDGTVWVEPIFKMLWSNKGLLPVLWHLFKDDPERSQYLLPAYFGDEAHGLTDYVRKPLLGREGANVTIYRGGEPHDSTDGQYGKEGFVVQQLAALPTYQAMEGLRHPVLGAWVIDGDPAGLGIRESSGLITDNQSFFVPHLVRECA